MPELAEVRICADFINDTCKNLIFWESPQKSLVSKVSTELSVKDPFCLSAKSRGKELILQLRTLEPPYREMNLLVNLGMSGNFVKATSHEKISANDLPKHTHLMFHGKVINKSGMQPETYVTLGLVDPRRFAKWRWTEWFSENRGADPVLENSIFVTDLKKWKEDKEFSQRPLFEAMLDQKAFNGVGNYLRSSIIKMMDINPFLKFGELSEEEIDALGKTTKLACEYFYMTKGGQLRDWKNPFGESGDFRSLLYYQQGESLYDKGKRRFWFDPKWKATEKYKEYVKQ